MRTLVDLPKEDIEALDQLSRCARTSRAAIIRAAISDYLSERDGARRQAAMEAVFGIWKGRGIDGLDYQQKIRTEWERDPL